MIFICLLPQPAADEGEDEEAGVNYQLEMMRCLREVNVDNNTVRCCAPGDFSMVLRHLRFCVASCVFGLPPFDVLVVCFLGRRR